MVGGGCQAQQLLAPWHSWVVDGLHIDAVLGEQEITDLAVECCIAHLGSKLKPFSTSHPEPPCHTSSVKEGEGPRSRNNHWIWGQVVFHKGLRQWCLRNLYQGEPRASTAIWRRDGAGVLCWYYLYNKHFCEILVAGKQGYLWAAVSRLI